MAGNLTIELSKQDLMVANKWLSEMAKVDQGSTVQRALRQGAEIIQNAGKTNLSSRNQTRTGNLKKSFGIKVVKKKAYALAGFKRPKGAHAHLVDRGTAKRYTSKGYYRGAARPSYFWTDAVQMNGGEALNNLMNAIYQSLNEINRRNTK